MIVTVNNYLDIFKKLKKGGTVFVDTETTGLRWYQGAVPFSIIISTHEHGPYYFNLIDYKNDEYPKINREIFAQLKRFFSEGCKTFVAHNAKFDMHMLENLGIVLGEYWRIYCTMSNHKLVNNILMNYSLDKLTNKKADTVAEFFKQARKTKEGRAEYFEKVSFKGKTKNEKCFCKLPPDVVVPYAIQDVIALRALYEFQQSNFKEQLEKYEVDVSLALDIEMKATRVIYKCERIGMMIDEDYCKKGMEEELYTAAKYRALFEAETGKKFVGSGKSLGEILISRGHKLEKTATGQWQTTEKALAKIDDKIISIIGKIKKAEKRIDTYFRNFLELRGKDGAIHPNFKQCGASTLRMSCCIAKGTMIEVLRDVRKYPKGKAIEDVVAGDTVYCFDNSEKPQLALRKVLWAGKTGTKKVIRVHWRAERGRFGGFRNGYLDVTPEHLFRKTDGNYVEASKLEKGDSLLSFRRRKQYGYELIFSSNSIEGEKRESRFVLEKIIGRKLEVREHAHHIDRNKSNNKIDNIVLLDRVDHALEHGLETSMRQKGIPSPNNFKTLFKKYDVIKALCKNKGRPTKIKGSLYNDYGSFKDLMTYHHITSHTLKLIRSRYDNDGRYISKRMVLECINKRGKVDPKKFLNTTRKNLTYLVESYKLSIEITIDSLKEILRINDNKITKVYSDILCPTTNFTKLSKLYDSFGIDYKTFNHEVTSIEYINSEVDVYDLHVEELNNFIANEVCVHNSEPNVQNVSSDDEEDEEKKTDFPLRPCFKPRAGFRLMSIDFAAQEMRCIIDAAGETALIEKIKGGLDVHQATADELGTKRKQAKGLGFALIYGSGIKAMSANLKVHVDEGRRLKELYFQKLPNVKDLSKALVFNASEYGFITTVFGNRLWIEPEREYIAVNYFVQGTCALHTKNAAVKVDHFLTEGGYKTRILALIHDELLIEISEDEYHLIPEIRRLMSLAYPHRTLPQGTGVEVYESGWGGEILFSVAEACENISVITVGNFE